MILLLLRRIIRTMRTNLHNIYYYYTRGETYIAVTIFRMHIWRQRLMGFLLGQRRTTSVFSESPRNLLYVAIILSGEYLLIVIY